MHGCGIELTIYFDIFALCRLSQKKIYTQKKIVKKKQMIVLTKFTSEVFFRFKTAKLLPLTGCSCATMILHSPTLPVWISSMW